MCLWYGICFIRDDLRVHASTSQHHGVLFQQEDVDVALGIMSFCLYNDPHGLGDDEARGGRSSSGRCFHLMWSAESNYRSTCQPHWYADESGDDSDGPSQSQSEKGKRRRSASASRSPKRSRKAAAAVKSPAAVKAPAKASSSSPKRSRGMLEHAFMACMLCTCSLLSASVILLQRNLWRRTMQIPSRSLQVRCDGRLEPVQRDHGTCRPIALCFDL